MLSRLIISLLAFTNCIEVCFGEQVTQNVTHLEYKPLQLQCQGVEANETVEWLFTNEPIDLESGRVIITPENQLKLAAPRVGDSGIYVCQSTATGEIASTFQVSIQRACPSGFQFPIIAQFSSVQIPCDDFHPFFNRFQDAVRTCGDLVPDTPTPAVIDNFSGCTLKDIVMDYVVFLRWSGTFFRSTPDEAGEQASALRPIFGGAVDQGLPYEVQDFKEVSLQRSTSDLDLTVLYSFTAPGHLGFQNLTTSLTDVLMSGAFYEGEHFVSASATFNVVRPSSQCDCLTDWGTGTRTVHSDEFCVVPSYIEDICSCNSTDRRTCNDQLKCLTGLVKMNPPEGDPFCAVDLDSDAVPDSSDPCIGCCAAETLYGLVWPQTAHNTHTEVSCSLIHSGFTAASVVRRFCGRTGQWSPAATFDACTFDRGAVSPVMLYTTVFNVETTSLIGATVAALQSSIESALSTENVNYTAVEELGSAVNRTEIEYKTSFLIEFQNANLSSAEKESIGNALNLFRQEQPSKRRRSDGRLSSPLRVPRLVEVGIQLKPLSNETQGFITSTECSCGAALAAPVDPSSLFREVCSGQGLTPCVCDSEEGGCMCSSPYVSVGGGNSTTCALDSDGDMIPDAMDSCVNLFSEDNSCTVPSAEQLVSGCPNDVDKQWEFTWTATAAESMAVLLCQDPPVNISGFVTRRCDNMGQWKVPDASGCSNPVIMRAAGALALIASVAAGVPLSPAEAREVDSLTQTILDVTLRNLQLRTSVFPSDLEATTDFIAGVAKLAEDNNLFDIKDYDVGSIVSVTSNILSPSNQDGWLNLNDAESAMGPTELLRSIERLSRGVGRVLRTSREPVREFARKNIVITAFTIEGLGGFQRFDVMGGNITNMDTDFDDGELPQLQIPSGYLSEVDANDGVMDDFVPVTYVVIKNIDVFLPRRFSSRVNQNGPNEPGSTIFSVQVGAREMEFESATLNGGSPVEIMINLNSASTTGALCTFWNFSDGGWDSEGLSTQLASSSGQATCSSTHLTSFTVLVDSSGSTQPPEVALAFSILTYIGCAISIACLVLTIVFLLTLWKEILAKVNYFVLLNLTIALLCALIIFVAGIQTAIWNDIACTVVSALLHYFFLAAFSWMLCEAVLIYNLLVKVFGAHKRRWVYIFSALGWGIPIPILIISLGSRWDYYYIRESTNQTSALYHQIRACWLSSEEGVIWAFIAPMLAIIFVNTVLLAISMYHLYKSRFGKGIQKIGGKEDAAATRKTAKQLFKAVIILMPLMGVTWVIGLFAVSSHPSTYILSIAFIVCNTLQGVAIFFFHVIRHDKIWSKIIFVCSKVRGKEVTSKGPSSSRSNKTRTSRAVPSPAASMRSRHKYDKSSSGTVQLSQEEPEQSGGEKIELDYLHPEDNQESGSKDSRASLASIGDVEAGVKGEEEEESQQSK